MYVRWKRQPLRRRRFDSRPDRTAMRAVLVAAERRDGKPRQRIVAYLGSIDDYLAQYPWNRQHFWREVEARLAALHLEPSTREHVLDALSVRVPRPTENELEAARARMVALEQQIQRGRL